METKKEIKNVYAKLQEARVKLQNCSLKKSGKNTYSKYNYFELGDFLPDINNIFNELGLCAVFSYEKESANLMIYNIDNIDERILFDSPTAPSDLKGALPIQSLGAMHTYMRRYLYLMALEIVEQDAIDAMPLDNKPQLTQEQELAILDWKETIKNCDSVEKLREYYKGLLKNPILEFLDNDFSMKQKELKTNKN